MNPGAVVTLLACMLPALGAGQTPTRTTDADTAGAHNRVLVYGLEHLFDGGEFTEGPAVAPDGSVYFSDLTFADTGARYSGHIWRFDNRTGSCRIYRSPSNMSNGIAFDAAGRMIIAEGDGSGGGRVVRTDLGSGKTDILAASFGGAPFNSPNDLTIGRDGRIILTDPRYGDAGSVQQPVMGVYAIDTAGVVSLLIRDVPMPNGVALSPDGRTLYVGCFDEGAPEGSPPRPKRMALYAYPLLTSGAAGRGRVLVDYGARDGPDGIEVDCAGRLVVAVRDEARPGVAVYDSGGSEIGFIPLPEIPSNVAFDRPPHVNRLYITAGRGLYRVHLNMPGAHSSSPEGSRHE